MFENDTNSIYNSMKPDDTIPLASLARVAKTEEKTTVEPFQEETDQYTPKKKISPLEEMAAKAHEMKGLKVTNTELKAGEEKELKNYAENDERMGAINERLNDFDESLRKSKAVVVLKPAANQQEYIETMCEIDSVKFKDNGEAWIDTRDNEGNPIPPKFIRLRTKDDPEFDEESFKKFTEASEEDQAKMLSEKASEASDAKKEEDEETIDPEVLEKRNIVNVLIDKTGFGADFAFTDEEREKLRVAEEIRLTEVSYADIETVLHSSTDKTFQEVINSFELADSLTQMPFPTSGFRADLKGLTYGELSDIALAPESSVTFDQYKMRLSILYHKMCNMSCSPFESFEDFMKKISYLDVDLGVFGMYISSQPDVQEIELQCSCNKYFRAPFKTRSLLLLDQCDKAFLDKMKLVSTCNPADYDKIQKESVVSTSKFVKFNESKMIFELGIVSAYEFLYNVIPATNTDNFESMFGKDPNGVYADNTLLLTIVKSVHVLTSDGKWAHGTNYKDILDAIYRVSPNELQILTNVYIQLMKRYVPRFGLKDVVCPHCKQVSEYVPVDVDSLVFHARQRSTNTSIDVGSIVDF